VQRAASPVPTTSTQSKAKNGHKEAIRWLCYNYHKILDELNKNKHLQANKPKEKLRVPVPVPRGGGLAGQDAADEASSDRPPLGASCCCHAKTDRSGAAGRQAGRRKSPQQQWKRWSGKRGWKGAVGFQFRGLLAPLPAAPFYSAPGAPRGPAAWAVQAPPSKPVPAHRRTAPAVAIGCCLNKKETELTEQRTDGNVAAPDRNGQLCVQLPTNGRPAASLSGQRRRLGTSINAGPSDH